MIAVDVSEAGFTESGIGFMRGYEKMLQSSESMTLQDRMKVIEILREVSKGTTCQAAAKLDQTVVEYVQHRIDDVDHHTELPFEFRSKSPAERENDKLKQENEQLKRERDQALEAVKKPGFSANWDKYVEVLREQNAGAYVGLKVLEEEVAKLKDTMAVLSNDNGNLIAQLLRLGVKPQPSEFPKEQQPASA